ncbi:MAG: AarF/ABC1/UbiB kinase family protein [Firmicutes bacterium]|nr:AarF/ABC1/UbiB kinase family protein [Bacillota bacterium]
MHFYLLRSARHLGRARQIANVLVKHGFGFVVDRLGGVVIFSIPRRALRRKALEREGGAGGPGAGEKAGWERVRLVAEDLGPTFIKLGQLLSTRPDVVPRSLVTELMKLQDEVSPISYAEIATVIASELGSKVEDLFTFFDPEPIAAASIGQVHRAILTTGEEVAIKVQRPGIERTVQLDLEILEDIAQLAEGRFAWAELYKPSIIVREFADTLRRELDYTTEAHNADVFARNFANDPSVRIPRVFWEFTSRRVLTLEYIRGIKVNDLQGIDVRGWDRRKIAENLARSMFKQIIIDGFFHADPHPGNITVVGDGTLAFVDFGMVGRLDEETRDKAINFLLAIVGRRASDVVRAMLDLGAVSPGIDVKQLELEIQDILQKYYDTPLNKINVGEVIESTMDLAFRYRIRMPSNLALLVKCLVTLEGIVDQLDPSVSPMEIAEPLGRQLLREKYAPEALAKSFVRGLVGYLGDLRILPEKIISVLSLMQEGELKLKHEYRELERAISKLTSAFNRLSFSIVVAGILVGSALVAQRSTGTGSIIGKLPLAELGLGIAAALGMWLLISIIRSGRL